MMNFPNRMNTDAGVKIKLPKYLYHRTTEKSFLKIINDGKILCTGTPASSKRFEKEKFDENGNDLWKCIFLATSIRISAEMVFRGDIVLKIKTTNLDKSKFGFDEAHNGCFRYWSDIPVSEIYEIKRSNRHRLVQISMRTDNWMCAREKNPYFNILDSEVEFI